MTFASCGVRSITPARRSVAAASELYYQGLDDLALRTVRSVRSRHDGAKRNPFSEPEAGHHYARSMASWGTYLAWRGFGWDATTGEMRFANRTGVHFFAVGPAWGVATVGADKVEIGFAEGRLPIRKVLVDGQDRTFSQIRARTCTDGR